MTTNTRSAAGHGLPKITRRAALAGLALAVAPVAGYASEAVAPADKDLIALCRQFIADHQMLSEGQPDDDAAFDRMYAAFDQIGTTPATTVAGVTWKARALAEWFRAEMSDPGSGEEMVTFSLLRDAANLEGIA